MANMTFKASLLPDTDLGYSLGFDNPSKRWKIYGDLYGTTWNHGPLKIGNSDTVANTGYATDNVGSQNYICFYGVYGDNPGGFNHTYIGESIYGSKTTANEQSELLLFHGNDPSSSSGPDRIRLYAGQVDIQVYPSALSGTWDTIRASSGTQIANFSSTGESLNGLLKITNNSNTVTIGSQNSTWTHIYNTASIPFIFNNSLATVQGDLGVNSYPWKNLVLGKNGTSTIKFITDRGNWEPISFLDTSADAYGVGVRIGACGLTVVGAGESSTNLISAASLTTGNENLYLTADSDVILESTCNEIANRKGIKISSGNVIPIAAETNSNNTLNLGASGIRFARCYLGSADSYGGTAKPIYWNAGVPTAISATVGGTAQPTYLNAGTITVCSATVGSGVKPVFMSSGTITASNSTVGSGVKPVYLTAGTITASNSSIGNTTTPAYMASGTLTAGYPYLRYINTNDTTTWTADSLSQTDSIAFTRANITGAYTTGHIVWLNARTIGTPFQLVVHDSSDLYLYKRWYSNSAWSAWTKMNAGSSDKTGDGTIFLYANNANEINFGGTSTATAIYFGYRATDSRPIPTNFVFGGTGNATITAANFTGNAASASTLKPQYVTGVNPNTMYTTGFYTIGSLASGATLPVSCWAEMAVFNYHTNGGSGRVLQIVWHDNETADRAHYMRSCYDGTWKDWKRIWVQGNAVTGAVWNDYAEFRQADTIESGYVLIEKGDDTLIKSTKRLQDFAGVSSDTWGFAQGETENAKTPIAVAGRVLVYTDKDRKYFKTGDYVCTGKDGKVSKMHWWEKILFPHKVVGVVSSVPDYGEWGGGDRPPIKVDGRVWIKVCQ